MIRFIFAVVYILAIHACTFVFLAVPSTWGQDKSTLSDPKTDGIKCEVWSLDPSSQSAENKIRISIRNLRPTDTTINSLAVYLSSSVDQEPYVGLVNLETKGPLDPKQFREGTSLKISAKGEATFTVDLSDLKWGTLIQATLPAQSLRSMAPGKLTLYVVITKDGESVEHRSNRISIQLHK